MGKTYRYDTDEAAVTNRPSWERPEEDFGFEEYAPKTKKRSRKSKAVSSHAPMTPEWAMDLMRERVRSSLDLLVAQNIILRHEFEDYEQIINAHICRILPTYDGSRKGAEGRTSSVERFLWVAIDNVIKNIKMHVARRRKNIPTMPLSEMENDDEDETSRKECESDAFSDHCKNFRELWFRMDFMVLVGMLNEDERMVLALRLDGLSYSEIAQRINQGGKTGIDRYYVAGVLMEGIRKAALECGFEPPSLMRERK